MEIFQEVPRLTFGEASSRRLQSAQTLRFTDSAMKCFVRVSLCMCTCMYYGARIFISSHSADRWATYLH